MGVMRGMSCFWPRIVAKVPPLLNLTPTTVLLARKGKNG
jgi:hypothetical protein